MTVSERLKMLERSIQAIVKDAMQRAPYELSAYILDEMIFTKPDKRKDGSRRLPPNRGSKLRTLYGNLSRALTPNERGNISKVTAGGKNLIELDFGFDPLQQVKQGNRTGDLRYGLLHEKGGTIPHPGGTPYMVIKGKAKFVTKAAAGKYFAKTGRELPVTKAHTITMPKRPFLKPGKAKYMKQEFPKLIDEIIERVIDELGGLS